MQLVSRSILCIFAFFLYLSAGGAVETDVVSLDTPIGPFSSHGKRTAEVFKQLAYDAHVPIGISGFVIAKNNSEERTISIDMEGKSLREVLDEICRQDPNYKWQQFRDHGIDVRLGARPLTLLNVVVRNFTVEGPILANSTLSLFLDRPEVKRWGQTHRCGLGHPVVLNGNPQPDRLELPPLQIRDEPLWKIFNELSIKSQRYFWLVIGSSAEVPCYIDINVLSGR